MTGGAWRNYSPYGPTMTNRTDLTAESLVLQKWFAYCRRNKLVEKGKALLLLQDYSEGNMSEEFYRRHAEEALATLDGLDQSKKGVASLQENLTPVIQQYAEKGPFDELF